MGLNCSRPKAKASNVVHGGIGNYIAYPSPVVVDATPDDVLNPLGLVNKPYTKPKRNAGKYVLHAEPTTVESSHVSSAEVPETRNDTEQSRVKTVKFSEKEEVTTIPTSKNIDFQKPTQHKEIQSQFAQSNHVLGPSSTPTPQEASENVKPAKKEKVRKNDKRIANQEQKQDHITDTYSLHELRRTYHFNFEEFLINNLLFAVHFEVEWGEVSKAKLAASSNARIDSRQDQMSSRLTATGHLKRVICPDAFHEYISSVVRFSPPALSVNRWEHGVPLRPVRVMIVYNDIEVIDQEHVYVDPKVAEYLMPLKLEQATQAGYAMLKQIGKQGSSIVTGSYDEPDDYTYSRLSDYDVTEERMHSIATSVTSSVLSSEDEGSRTRDEKIVTTGLITNDPLSFDLSSVPDKVNDKPCSSRQAHYPETFCVKENNEFVPEHMDIIMEGEESPPPQSSLLNESSSHGQKRVLETNMKTRIDHLQTAQQRESRTSATLLTPRAPSSKHSVGGDSTNDSEYGYSTITNLKAPQTLEERIQQTKPFNMASKFGLPGSCFVPITIRCYNDEEIADVLFETKYYLSSQLFMDNFSNTFATLMAKDLGFAPNTIRTATVCGATITCQSTTIKLDLIPTMNCLYPNWPEKAVEWLRRSRRQAYNQRRKKLCSWPTLEMREEARSKGYHLIPIGFMPRKNGNPNTCLEWAIEFPEAEKYLETCLSHTQLRCYIFCLLLFQTFFSVPDSVNENHIRHVIFQQAENLTLTWENFQMSKNINTVFDYLYFSLSNHSLPNYFIRKKNEFESIPTRKLLTVQKRIANFKENRFGHVVAAIKHLVYAKEPDPIFNLERLLHLIKASYDVELANPALRNLSTVQEEITRKPQASDTESVDFWADMKKDDEKRNWSKRYTKIKEEQKIVKARTKLMSQSDVQATNQTHIEINLSKFNPSPIRKKMILELFIEHFIKLARKGVIYRKKFQVVQYLSYTENLFILFKESGEVEDGKLSDIREQLNQLRHDMNEMKKTILSDKDKAAMNQSDTETTQEHVSPHHRSKHAIDRENWKLKFHPQYSDTSEGMSTDMEIPDAWRKGKPIRDAPPTMFYLRDAEISDSTDL